jgi:DNA polymerase-3 subunit beta
MSSQIVGDEIELAMADAGSPTLVRDPKDASTLYVLMPMRV